LESYIDASADMFTGEVGLDPMAHHAVGYVDRLSQNLESGFAYGWVADGEILFKVDVGAVTPTSCQIQGVWLIPRLRGQGLSVELMRQALILIQQDFHVTPCLYVNDFNAPALALYRKLGFETLDEFMTLFF
jgi:predicted GNAT family acetyltransferase